MWVSIEKIKDSRKQKCKQYKLKYKILYNDYLKKISIYLYNILKPNIEL